MRRLFLTAICLILLISCANRKSGPGTSGVRIEVYEKDPYLIRMTYPDGEAAYGSRLEIKLTAEYPEEEQWILLPPDSGSGEEYSNTIIHDISRGPQILIGNGKAKQEIIIELEAYLPGEIILPPLTARFRQDITTEKVVIRVESAFGDDSEQKELSPLWIPEARKKNSPLLYAAAAGAVIAAAAAAIILMLRRRGLRKSVIEPEPEKTAGQLLDGFKKDFIERSDASDLHEAFRRLGKIIDRLPVTALHGGRREELKRICSEAGFSRGAYSLPDGSRLLRQIFDELAGGEN